MRNDALVASRYRHPANIRLLRRLKRLEKKVELLGATSMPLTETRRRKRQWYAAAAPRTRQKAGMVILWS
eukprot:s681_g5.t1